MFWRLPITPVRWRVQSPNSDQSLHSLHLRLCKGQPRTQCSLRVPWGVVWFILWLSVPGNEQTATNHCVTPNHSRERESKAHLHTTCTLSLPSAQCLPNTLRFWVLGFFCNFPLATCVVPVSSQVCKACHGFTAHSKCTCILLIRQWSDIFMLLDWMMKQEVWCPRVSMLWLLQPVLLPVRAVGAHAAELGDRSCAHSTPKTAFPVMGSH